MRGFYRSIHEDLNGTTSPDCPCPHSRDSPHTVHPMSAAQGHQPLLQRCHSSASLQLPTTLSIPIPRAVTDAGAPSLPVSQPSGYPGSSAPLPEAVGHSARKNYWVKYWECQTQAAKKNEDIHKKLSTWLLGLYYISFHLHGITPSPCETGRDWVSVTQGSSHLCNCQSILSCNTPTCNFADEMIIFAVSPLLLY